MGQARAAMAEWKWRGNAVGLKSVTALKPEGCPWQEAFAVPVVRLRDHKVKGLVPVRRGSRVLCPKEERLQALDFDPVGLKTLILQEM